MSSTSSLHNGQRIATLRQPPSGKQTIRGSGDGERCHGVAILRDTGTVSVDENTGLLMYKSILNGRRQYVPILPSASRSAVMKALHDLPMSGHLGRKKRYHRVRSQHYRKRLGQDVKDFVRSSMECQCKKTPKPSRSGKLLLLSATRPFEVVGVDILGPLPRTVTGNRYIAVMVDRFSRWVELAPVTDITAGTVADAVVDRIVLRYGCPTTLLSDSGRNLFPPYLILEYTQYVNVDSRSL